ncbi:Rv0623 family protein transcription factor [Rhizobium sp. CF080]|uniref:type II toxin-antitoxin system VapB family antitoxin n=1 Tax=Rhizobium sp. (strain CF080) TaxID=1144310 RepID=UPI000271A42A|nr:type II toxin-antitoxin system VapB family antitoxin [Rhizobium sp. CF080]EUB95057.1 Rv0623 family protein transcription factor [Rhizobium sp. CF080]
MPLYVRDERVNELAEQARKILKAPTKTDAIRQALQRVVEASEASDKAEKPPLRERLDQLRKEFNLPEYSSLPPFDEKAFLDDMWGENDVHR